MADKLSWAERLNEENISKYHDDTNSLPTHPIGEMLASQLGIHDEQRMEAMVEHCPMLALYWCAFSSDVKENNRKAALVTYGKIKEFIKDITRKTPKP